MLKNKLHILTTLSAFYLIALATFISAIGSVHAAGVAVTMTPSALASATATEVVFSYIASAQYANTNTVSIEAGAGVTIANTCAVPTIDADGTTTDGSGSVTGQVYTYTFTAATTAAATTGVSFCVKLTAATGNYSLVFTDSKTVTANNDYGGALIYVGSANVVNVTAQIQPALSFVIRNSADSGNTNTCALGTLSLVAVNTCAYRLKITTNSASGYTVQVNTNGDLRKSGTGDVANALDLDLIPENSTVTSGIEGYGVAFVGGSNTGGAVTESGDFSDDDTPLPINSATTMFTGAGTNNPAGTDTTNTALVTHRAAMDGDTETGLYTQQVTYTVSASF